MRTGVVDGVGEALPVSLASKADVEALLGVPERADGEVPLGGHHVWHVGRTADVAERGAVVEQLSVRFLNSERFSEEEVLGVAKLGGKDDVPLLEPLCKLQVRRLHLDERLTVDRLFGLRGELEVKRG